MQQHSTVVRRDTERNYMQPTRRSNSVQRKRFASATYDKYTDGILPTISNFDRYNLFESINHFHEETSI